MADWPRIAATLDPVTYILDGLRALTVTRRELDRHTPHCSPPEPSARPHSGLAWGSVGVVLTLGSFHRRLSFNAVINITIIAVAS